MGVPYSISIFPPEQIDQLKADPLINRDEDQQSVVGVADCAVLMDADP